MALAYQSAGIIEDLLIVTQGGLPIGIQTKQGFSSLVSGPFLKTALPPVADLVGQVIFVSNSTHTGGTGSLCFSNGTNWIDTTTGVAVA